MMKIFIIPHKKGTEIRKSELYNRNREIALLKMTQTITTTPRSTEESLYEENAFAQPWTGHSPY